MSRRTRSYPAPHSARVVLDSNWFANSCSPCAWPSSHRISSSWITLHRSSWASLLPSPAPPAYRIISCFRCLLRCCWSLGMTPTSARLIWSDHPSATSPPPQADCPVSLLCRSFASQLSADSTCQSSWDSHWIYCRMICRRHCPICWTIGRWYSN